MTEETAQPIPVAVHRAALHTLYRAMVFCRNFATNPNANIAVVQDLMDALHEVPCILDRWGTYDNSVEKLRLYFGCFNHQKWKNEEAWENPPDLVLVFNDKLRELENE